MALSDAVKDLGEARNAAAKEFQAEFAKEASVLFANAPSVIGMRWRAYAPGFNDGDPCVFEVHEPHFLFAATSDVGCEIEEDDESDDSWREVWGDEDRNKVPGLGALIDWFNELSGEADLFEAAFGSGHEGTLRRDGDGVKLTVEDYDCGY